jgi:flagellar biogenesis protein FliO
MFHGNDISSRRWVLMLLLGTVLSRGPVMAADAAAPSPPAVPAGPGARSIPAPPVAPATPSSSATSNAPVDTNDKRPSSPADEKRMIDLAKRITTDPKESERPAAAKSPEPGRPTKLHEPSPGDPDKADPVTAAQSNKQRLADPDALKPLGARNRSAATTGESPAKSNPFSLLPVLSALGVVIGLIFAIRAGLRRFVGGAMTAGQSSAVQVLTRVAVAPRSHLLLIRVGGRVLVVSDSAAGMRTLAQFDGPEEVADLLTSVSSSRPNSASAGFRQTLSGMNEAYDKMPASQEGGDENEFRIDSTRDRVSGLLGKLRSLVGKEGDA